jgi:hypothetical protein
MQLAVIFRAIGASFPQGWEGSRSLPVSRVRMPTTCGVHLAPYLSYNWKVFEEACVFGSGAFRDSRLLPSPRSFVLADPLHTAIKN